MLASNGTAETIGYFVLLLRERSPLIIPHWLMTDRDLAQINALRHYFPTSTILLCWWHVLHTWQQHLVISQNIELWDKLKAWVRIECLKNFEAAWVDIQRLSPRAFHNYLVQYWMTDEFRAMWSAVNCKDRAIFERSDTNMLLEAWHHVLKWKFLEGCRNRRVDHLLYILLCKVIEYYSVKQNRESVGFEGPNLETHKCKTILQHSEAIPISDVHESDPGHYRVKSSSIADHIYDINIIPYNCTCRDFPEIRFCKHIAAVQRHFPFSDTVAHSELDALSLSLEPSETPPSSSPALEDLVHIPPGSNEVISATDTRADADKELNRLCVIEKLEMLAACLRCKGSDIVHDDNLEELLDSKLSLVQHGVHILPPAKCLSPHLNSWPETQSTMLHSRLPAKKTQKKHVGDAYGAGDQSGKKAKRDSEVEGSKKTTFLQCLPSQTTAPAAVKSPVLPTAVSLQPLTTPAHFYYHQGSVLPASGPSQPPLVTISPPFCPAPPQQGSYYHDTASIPTTGPAELTLMLSPPVLQLSCSYYREGTYYR
ncbi:uncharacterized protein LACBIDRAFT_297987 [Laccaria bicolor S238N-H82]|uniref:Predicted protein n=1 Tax=Laccaria bicolor (strain S238N-H82 / ATCC MYA-4686) TaxID=486041 RepID=B0DC01_LACBS|nr:uncharacterized protein LACBIDRAFT_297987 [Laccaria bicolor S238N-H82]EDR07809.1 predicted protein [Laccaria bicolor S238N-H82]|eukprot:XP_001881598.1 predicted protein [Laccaria bicolor S238N-H82]